ncbi:hypothetical protein [Polyangium aurulentum]|uniref:hypothetical protein n=1 Tax=Polyangium aurulentum TaxID=2567896 RepID=UPI0010AEC5F1|nr:hypothetical protein [Polyangium aurulentum]UQA58897.1 hypothetical protein E8A73_048065 [Polyangium aurulentum]
MNIPDAPFPSYVAKQADIDQAWAIVEQRLSALPPPLDELGARFLRSVSRGDAGHRGYFSGPLAPPLLYMPLWLCDGLRTQGALPAQADAAMPLILAGTMHGYLYVRIQDDALDEPGRGGAEMLLLGNACIAAMFDAYRKALGTHGPFWEAFDRAFLDFSRLTLAEARAVRSDAPYTARLFDEHANKVAFARVPLLAVAAIAGKMELERSLGELVHLLGIAHGHANDALGWPRDLVAGQRTRLLAEAGLVRADLEAVARAPEGAEREAAQEALAERMRKALYEGMLLHRTLGEAIAAQRRAGELGQRIGLAGFDAFTDERVAWLEALDQQVLALSLRRALAAAAPRS